MIRLSHLHKTYPQQTLKALDDITLFVKAGEIFGVIGRSGAGKSTLIRCINLLERPESGVVNVAGTDLMTLSPGELRKARRKIGMIFQHFNLLESRTVEENIALPLELVGTSKQAIQTRVKELLTIVGLNALAKAYPDQLSGGQKQRVAIARALTCKPDLLLSDEATSALDPETTISILQLLKTINQQLGITIVLITHEMEVIKRICHRMAVIDQGKIVEQGDVLDVFVHPNHPVTQALTQSALHMDLPERIQEKLQPEKTSSSIPVVKISFVGASTSEPLLVMLYKKFEVMANILQADLEFINDSPMGISICELRGNPENVTTAIEYIKSQGLGVEVIGYV